MLTYAHPESTCTQFCGVICTNADGPRTMTYSVKTELDASKLSACSFKREPNGICGSLVLRVRFAPSVIEGAVWGVEGSIQYLISTAVGTPIAETGGRLFSPPQPVRKIIIPSKLAIPRYMSILHSQPTPQSINAPVATTA